MINRVTTSTSGLLAAALLFSAPAWTEVDVLSYLLRSLDTTGEVDLGDYRGKVSLLMFFEPECEYCIRQTRILNRLVEACPGFQPFAIGANGSRAALQREMRRMRPDFPVAQISPELQADVGEIIGTPMMLLSDRGGMLVTWLRGIQSEDVLRELIENVDPRACDGAGTSRSDGRVSE